MRKIDPSRRSIPFHQWPEQDRNLWSWATEPADVFDGGGSRAHWAERTKETNIKHYGRWIGWLMWTEQLDADLAPGDRATKELILDYGKHLRAIVAPRTVLSMLVGSKEALRAMEPDRNWRWFQDFCNAVQRWAKPSRDKRLLVRSSEEIYLKALQELDLVKSEGPSLKQGIAFRDALMLALLTARVPRSKNLRQLRIGDDVIYVDGEWCLEIPGTDVKNDQPLDFTLPKSLQPHLDHYVDVVRPVFPEADATNQFWLNQYGARLGDQFVYFRVRKITKRLIGSALNPHLLRDCAATTLAIDAPEHVRAARPLLGHKYDTTTARYYIQADQLEASRRVNDLLDDIVGDDDPWASDRRRS